jgi:hypothetical protein
LGEEPDRATEATAAGPDTSELERLIDIGGLTTWVLRLVERQPDEPPERVTLDVVNEDGTPNLQMAALFRNVVETDRFP